jgi:short subunit dehydrogenase-like uncharacterized protein
LSKTDKFETMKNQILLYGATGYTGKLIVDALVAKGIKPLIAGRNAAALHDIAKAHGLNFEAFELNNVQKLESVLSKCKLVIHAAGPFIHTYQLMLDACIKTKTHYLDITGEYQVFEGCAAKDDAAKAAGIMVMPGVGFDVVPSDCLANYLKAKLPDATHLQLAFASVKSGFSRGTAKTMIEGLDEGGKIRKDGKLVSVGAAYKVQEINFGVFKTLASTIPWGDLSTAYRSTGIANIEVFMAVTPALVAQMKRSNYLRWFFKLGFVKSFLKAQVDKRKPGPSAKQRLEGRSFFWARVENAAGKSLEARLQTPEGYQLTSLTAVLITEKVLNDNFKTGYQSPAMAYGKDLILEIDGCKFSD